MICDRVAIIVDGRILSQGRLADLISEKILFTEITVSGSDRTSPGRPRRMPLRPGGRTLLKVFDEDKVQDVLDLVRDGEAKVHSLIPRTQTLEDLFVDMVKPQ